jgi:hypothetical protein
MRRLEHMMPGEINQLLLFLGRPAPEQKNHSSQALTDYSNRGIGKNFPTSPGVRMSFSPPHSQHRVN